MKDFIAKSSIAEKLLEGRMTSLSIGRAPGEFINPTRRPFRGIGRAFCPLCREEVELLSFRAAGLIFNADHTDIDHRTESGSVHRLHNRLGVLMVCGTSRLASYWMKRWAAAEAS